MVHDAADGTLRQGDEVITDPRAGIRSPG